MRGNEAPQVRLFSYVHLEDRKPLRHPLRLVRRMVDQALAGLDGAFATMYATTGRPSIPPERLLRAWKLEGPEQPPSHAIRMVSSMRTLACISLSSEPGTTAPGGGAWGL